MTKNRQYIAAAIFMAILCTFVYTKVVNVDSDNHKEKIPTISDAPQRSTDTKTLVNKTNTEGKVEPEETFLTETLADQISDFVDFYEQSARYPVYSIPITDPEWVDLYRPFEQTAVDTPLFDQDGNILPIKVNASVDKYQYFMGDQITLRLDITGLQTNQLLNANATIKKPGGYDVASSALDLTPIGDDFSRMTTTFDTNNFKSGLLYGDLIAAVLVNIDGNTHVTTVPLVLNERAPARLDNLGVTQVDGAFLNIPLQFSVAQEGYYFVQAYLFEQETDRPLMTLQTEGKMRQGNDVLNLRAHQHAIKDAGSTGPYTLKIHRIYRSANPRLNEMKDSFVATNSSEFFVPGFNYEDYKDEAYVDEETQRRISALRELTARPETNNQSL